jgi:hypothetical protein
LVKRTVILFSLQSFILTVFAQRDTVSPSFFSNKKLVVVAAANAAFYTTSFIILNQAWYADYDKTRFHFFNDNPEWNQMDKGGHVWTTYQVSRLSNEMWKWTGLNNNTSALLGGASGLVYQSIIEIQDAYSTEWGFSWGDVGADVTGAGLFVLQQIFGDQQKVSVRMSYYPKKYPAALIGRRDQLFGKSFIERILKDYNSQTYWLSANVSSIFPRSNLPRWLNVAIGYGSDGMYGGRSNTWTDKDGIAHDYTTIRRVRKFYLSPDIDLTKINTRSNVLRKVFFVLNMVKIPAPSLSVATGDKVKISFR